MNKFLRTFAVLSFLALSSALFGGSVNLGSLNSSSVVTTTVEGSYDGGFDIVNSDTNQVVVSGSFYKTFYGGSSSWWYADFTSSAWSDVSGVTVTAGGQSVEVTGLPEGNYRIDCYSISYPSAGETVNGTLGWSQPAVHFDAYGTGNWDWLDYYIDVY